VKRVETPVARAAARSAVVSAVEIEAATVAVDAMSSEAVVAATIAMLHRGRSTAPNQAGSIRRRLCFRR
jgi:hypothetical protein